LLPRFIHSAVKGRIITLTSRGNIEAVIFIGFKSVSSIFVELLGNPLRKSSKDIIQLSGINLDLK
jgi:hypothetical protein